jgi:hypothetical protein
MSHTAIGSGPINTSGQYQLVIGSGQSFVPYSTNIGSGQSFVPYSTNIGSGQSVISSGSYKSFSIGAQYHEIITIGDESKNPQKDTIYIGGTRKIILIDQTSQSEGYEEIDLIATIKDLSNELKEMKTLVKTLQTHIDYMPGGRGYEEAKASFESAVDAN